jgi:hypothetical protein
MMVIGEATKKNTRGWFSLGKTKHSSLAEPNKNLIFIFFS